MASSRTPNHDSQESRFRSWGEIQIALMLDRHGIPYLYEHPVAVVDAGKTRIWYPDFQLCGQGILLEYCGMPHDPAYAEGMDRKRTVYAANGITAQMYTPEVFRGNWSARILDQIEESLTDRLTVFRSARTRVAADRRRG